MFAIRQRRKAANETDFLSVRRLHKTSPHFTGDREGDQELRALQRHRRLHDAQLRRGTARTLRNNFV